MENNDARPRRRGDLHVGPVGSDVLVLDPDADSIYELNDTARAVFDLCDGSRTVAEIVQRLAERYHIAGSPQRLEGDVAAVLERLDELGLLERCGRDDT